MIRDRWPTDEDVTKAVSTALDALADGRPIPELLAEVADLHRPNNTFPAEVLLAVAADALRVAGVGRDRPIAIDGIRERFLPEWTFRGRNEHYKIRYTLYAAAALAGGVEPDLLEEAAWRNDDLHRYAALTMVIFMRAASEASGRTVPEICSAIARERSG
jgi:hypothetical protein